VTLGPYSEGKRWFDLSKGKQGEDETTDKYASGICYQANQNLSPLHSLTPTSADFTQLGAVTLLNKLSLTAVSSLSLAKSSVTQSSETYGVPTVPEQ